MILKQAAAAARLAWRLPGYLRQRVDVPTAAQRIRVRLENRADRFLDFVDRAVFGNPCGPYARLLRGIGCERGDFAAMLRDDGIEGALSRLAASGLFVTQQELKGRTPIVRGSLKLDVTADDFTNPLIAADFYVPTSGSTGKPLIVGRSLDEFAEVADHFCVAEHAHGLDRPAHVWWHSSPHYLFSFMRAGFPIVGWYNAMDPRSTMVRAGQHYLTTLCRSAGYPLPWAATHPLTDPLGMARRLAAAVVDRGQVCACAYVSAAVRVCAAAATAGVSLAGVTWLVTGEPLTRERREAIERAGARTLLRYSTMESGPFAFACAASDGVDDLHLSADRFAVVRHRRPAPGGADAVSALLITGVSATIPRVFINAEMGDDADIVERNCGCPLNALGLRTHLSNIRSFEKMTGEGMTFLGMNLIPLMEDVLPREFGGGPGDFQLAEVEGTDGLVKLVARVAPRVGEVSESDLRATIVRGLAGDTLLDRYMAEVVERLGALEIVRESPSSTPSGKTPAFVPMGRDRRPGS